MHLRMLTLMPKGGRDSWMASVMSFQYSYLWSTAPLSRSLWTRILEGKHKQVENRKRKSNTHHSGSHHKSRTSYDGYSKHGGSDHGSHDRRDGHRHDNHRSSHHNHKGGHSHHSGGHGGHDRNRDRNFVKKDLSEVTCFKCK